MINSAKHRSVSLVECLIFLIVLTTYLFQHESLEVAQASLKTAGSSLLYFNCDLVEGEETSCYPSSIPVSTYHSVGKSNKIYETSASTADYEEGKDGRALKFAGYLGEYLTLGGGANFALKNFSISFWIKEEPWFDIYAPIISNINGESTAGWLIDLQNNGTAVRFGLTNTEGRIVSSENVTITPGKFVNIVATFDGSTVKVYRDGNLSSSVDFEGTYDPNPRVPLRLGLDSFDNENSWAGSIEELRIYNSSINEEEVLANYDNANIVSKNLMGYWPFNGTLRDLSGNDHDAILRVQTVSMAFAPDGRMFFNVKRSGEIRIMENDTVLPEPFARTSELYLGDHQGLLGITLDPEFKSNHFVYVYSTYLDNKTNIPFNRVLRYTDSENRGTNLTVVMDKIPADVNGYYAGGALSFGPDDKLYITVGIGPRPGDAQDISSLLGKVLRINRDGTIPSDNPDPNSPIFATGIKNSYGIAFDKKNGTGILTDLGDRSYDEINLIANEANYGFPAIQYPTISSINTNNSNFPPIRSYIRNIAPTQAIFYDGTKIPQLSNNFVIGAYNDGNLRAFRIYENEGEKSVHELVVGIPENVIDNIVTVAQSPSGDIYYGGYNIYKLESVNSATRQSTFPIQTNMSLDLLLGDMKVLSRDNAIAINMTVNASSSTVKDQFVSMKIPRNLTDEEAIPSVNGCTGPPQVESIGNDLLVRCNLEAKDLFPEALVSVKLGSERNQQQFANPSELPNRIINRPTESD